MTKTQQKKQEALKKNSANSQLDTKHKHNVAAFVKNEATYAKALRAAVRDNGNSTSSSSKIRNLGIARAERNAKNPALVKELRDSKQEYRLNGGLRQLVPFGLATKHLKIANSQYDLAGNKRSDNSAVDAMETDFQARKMAAVADRIRSSTAGTVQHAHNGLQYVPYYSDPYAWHTPEPPRSVLVPKYNSDSKHSFNTLPIRGNYGGGQQVMQPYIPELPLPGTTSTAGQTLQPLSDDSITGKGYASTGVSAPSAVGFHARVSDAEFLPSEYPDGVRVRKREYVTDVFGTTAFNVRSAIPLNPGLETSFPFLSGIASRFQFYEFLSLKIIYLPSCSTSAAGSINISTDYKPSDSSPGTKADVLQYAETARSTPWTACEHYCQSENLSRHGDLIIRSNEVQSYDDIELYDVANLYISTGDQGGTTLIGEIWIEYDVQLHTTIPPGKYGLSSRRSGASSVANNFLNENATTPVANAYPLVTFGTNTFTFMQDFRGLLEIRMGGPTVVTGAGGVMTITSLPGFTHTFNAGVEFLSSAATIYHRAALCDVRAGQQVTFTFNYTGAPTSWGLNFYGLETIINNVVQAVAPEVVDDEWVDDENDEYKVMLKLARATRDKRLSFHV